MRSRGCSTSRSARCCCGSEPTPGDRTRRWGRRCTTTTSCWSSRSPTNGSAGRRTSRSGGSGTPPDSSSSPGRSGESGDLRIAEALLRYDGGDPICVVKILQFRGEKVERETLYFAEPFAAPEWRRPSGEPGPRPRRHTGAARADHRRPVTPGSEGRLAHHFLPTRAPLLADSRPKSCRLAGPGT